MFDGKGARPEGGAGLAAGQLVAAPLLIRDESVSRVPVNYKSRSYAEGKKVRFFRDPLTWLETIVTCRFESLRRDDA